MADQINNTPDIKFNVSTPIPTKPRKNFGDSAYSSFSSPLRTNLGFDNSPDKSFGSNLVLENSPHNKMTSNDEDELMKFFENIDFSEIQNQNEPHIRRSMRSPAWSLRPKSAPLNEENESDLDDDDRPTFSLSLADDSVSNQGIHEDILIHSEQIEICTTNNDDNDEIINTSATQVKRRIYKSRDINDNHIVSSSTTTSNTLTSHSASTNPACGHNRRHRFSITEDDLRKELIAIKLRSLAEKLGGNSSGSNSRSGNRSGLAQNREYSSEIEIPSMGTSNSTSRSSYRTSHTTHNLSGLTSMPPTTTRSSSSSSSLSTFTRTLFSSHYTSAASSAPQPRNSVGSSSMASFTEMMPSSCGYTLDLVYSLYQIYKLHRHVHRNNDCNNRNSLPNCESMASMANNNNSTASYANEARVNYRIRSLTE